MRNAGNCSGSWLEAAWLPLIWLSLTNLGLEAKAWPVEQVEYALLPEASPLVSNGPYLAPCGPDAPETEPKRSDVARGADNSLLNPARGLARAARSLVRRR